MKNFPLNLIKYQLYIFQLEEYDIERYSRAIQHKGLVPTDSIRKELNWTTKAKLIFSFSLISQLLLSLIDAYLIGILLFNSALIFVVVFIVNFFVVVYFSFLFLILASLYISPLESFQKNRIIAQAKTKFRKLKTNNPKLKTIGITGSFGKTTMKETLSTILSEKFKVVATPENINTPLGLARVILNNLKEDTEVFVVEMGEYVKGDVEALCEITPPDISVITGINEAHLERYGTMENAIDTKFEIVENTPNGGLVVLNGLDRLTVDNFERFTQGKNLQWYNHTKSKFQLIGSELDTERLIRKIEIKTPNTTLIAQTSIIAEYICGNVIASMIIGTELGMSEQQIKLGVTQLKPAPHRLEVKRTGDITIIDDTYNGNSDGIKAGINLLSQFKNNRKVYVTPGLVETGHLAEELHKDIGRELAKVADLVILTKNSVTPYIADGLKHSGFNKDKIIWYNTSKETYSKLRENLQSGDVVLMQNDWSDNYY